MLLINRNEMLLESLGDDLSLISSKLHRINIYEENNFLNIDIEVKLLYKKGENKILLRFIDVQEYSFYYSIEKIFYYVNFLKFLKKDDQYYISFDPVDESNVASEADQDFIFAKSVEGYYL